MSRGEPKSLRNNYVVAQGTLAPASGDRRSMYMKPFFVFSEDNLSLTCAQDV